MRKQNSDFRAAFLSEAGNQLKNNDYFGFVELDEYACYVIADGITDMPDADSARLAIETVILHFQERPSMSGRAMRRLIAEANKALIGGESYKRREASLTVVLTDYRSFRYGYLGNTRLRMYRGGQLFRQTQDMSLSREFLEREIISKDALQRHEERNNLYAYLGQTNAKPYISPKLHLMDTDILTLYTRGIWENVDESELDDIFSEADNEVQNALDNVEDMLLSKQPGDLENYTFAAIFINKIYSDPKREQKRKKMIVAGIVAVLVIVAVILVCIFLCKLRQRRVEDMNRYFTNTIEYINTENFVRAREECGKAQELADKVRDSGMQDRLQEYLLVIETVILADESFSGGRYEDASGYYVSAMDRARYADLIGTDYMEAKLEKTADYLSIADYLSLGDLLLEREDYEKAEEKYLLAKKLSTACHYREGKEAAMTALETLYTQWEDAKELQKQDAGKQAEQEASAAELVACGDKACLEEDFAGANVYYTLALTAYQKMDDSVNQQYVTQKLDSVNKKTKEQNEKRGKAEGFEQQGAQAQGTGNYWGAKSQYLQAKNLYMEIGSAADIERVSNIIAQIDAMLEQ